MGRNLRNSVPVLPNQLNPKQPNSAQLKEREKERRGKQKQNFDRRHRDTDLKPLQSGDTVWIQGSNSGGRVIETSNPRSYVVRTPDGTSVRRNRRHLIPIHDQENSANENATPHNSEIDNRSTDGSVGIRTRSGRVSKPPTRFEEEQ